MLTCHRYALQVFVGGNLEQAEDLAAPEEMSW